MGTAEFPLLKEAFESNWIAPLGPHVDAFEQEVASYIGVEHACALSSGTAALHLALRISGIGKSDKVLCSSLTFAASANAILYQDAIPVFLDAVRDTWTLNVTLLERAIREHKPKGLIAVDLYGQSCDYDEITFICKKYGVILIEDAAESLGSHFNGKACGSFGQLAVLSFNGNKIITTSGGGMLVGNDKSMIDKTRHLATQAREPQLHYEHRHLGYNYRMSNLLAAVGRGQLKVLDERVNARREVFRRYLEAFTDVEGISFQRETTNSRSNRWLSTMTLDPRKLKSDRTAIINALDAENIEARPVWKPMHLQPLYAEYPYYSNHPDVSARLFMDGICLPSGSNLSDSDQHRIIDIIKSQL